MGMIGNFFRTDKETVLKLQRDELSLYDVIYDGRDFSKYADEEANLDISKLWHVIHFTLSGNKDWGSTEEPLSKVIPTRNVLNDNVLNEEDMGYGPAIFVSDTEVQEICSALKAVTLDWLRAKYSPSEMLANNIYLAGVGIEVEEVYQHLECIAAFYNKAAQENQYVLFFIN